MSENEYIPANLDVSMETYERARDLAHILITDGYPPEVVRGLRAIADALIERQGFEDAFKDFVRQAKQFIGARHGTRTQWCPECGKLIVDFDPAKAAQAALK